MNTVGSYRACKLDVPADDQPIVRGAAAVSEGKGEFPALWVAIVA